MHFFTFFFSHLGPDTDPLLSELLSSPSAGIGVVDPEWFQCGSVSRLLAFRSLWIRMKGCDDQKIKKITSWSFYLIYLSNISKYFFLGLHEGRPSQAGKASSPQKRTFSTSKQCISLLVLCNVVFVNRPKM